ncbi:hypothetical protein [Paenibacillus aestuarii]|uniref:DUF4044 domain-containing protein n=1 Tax=Paenibacillus aestuarii TaxID=516965 RepID=A0ABW0KG27_9BACL|nr:hypothetical protein [Paenibacillus aestuarii]
MPKRKPVVATRKPKDEVNKKAIIWTASVMLLIIIVMSILLVLNK